MTPEAENADPEGQLLLELFNQGVSLLDSAEYTEAEVLFRKMLAIAPDLVMPLAYLAVIEIRTGSDPTVLTPLDRLISENPDIPLYRYCRAKENYNIKNDDQLLEDVEACLGKLGPRYDVGLYEWRSEVLFEQRRDKEALENIEKALALENSDPDGLYVRARIRNRMDDFSGALADLKTIETEYHGRDGYCFERGYALFSLGKYYESLTTLDAWLESHGEDIPSRAIKACSLQGLMKY